MREERERRYIAEYVAEFYPRGGWTLNVPLGPIPAEILAQHGQQKGAALYYPTRPRVDAILSEPDAYWLIEAKIYSAKAAIGDLLVYKSLAVNTLDMPGYQGQPIKMRLVVPWAVEWIMLSAKEHGMDVAVYLPPWIEDYVREKQNYFTPQYRLARDEKMRNRRLLGLE